MNSPPPSKATAEPALALVGGPAVVTTPLPTIRNATGRLIGEEEEKLVIEVIRSGTLAYIYGDKVRRFETEFARLHGRQHGVAVSSGTAALHTALIYLDPEPGDEVIVSSITDMGSVIPILYQGAVPVFADVDPATQNMDPRSLEALVSPRTRAIMVTHIYGNPADMDPILALARRHNLLVIEDCAQAHLARYRGRLVGTLGDLGCYSFQQSKHITTGDGGMVIANEDARFGRRLRECFDKGWPRHKPGRDHLFLAPNYHMTELQAAVGLAQLTKYQACLSGRRRAAAQLDGLLAGEPAVEPVAVRPDCEAVYFHYCFRLRPELSAVGAAQFATALAAEGVPCEHGYPGPIPLYLYPVIRDRRTFGKSGWPFTSPPARKEWHYPPGTCPVAERLCQETVVLPWNERLQPAHVGAIATAIRKVARAYRA
ncbi:MAG: DegT/DnrJ/EryC1/StrS family aminotransferase [Opitutaceae bacterium]|nr:DegT/DnrJ/EryC1/StrS family aminotransferase [Opitutaceae bacterium]